MIAATVLLFANGVWNLVVWPLFFRRVSRDPRARNAAGRPSRFFVVHVVLVGISLLLGVASLVAALLALV